MTELVERLWQLQAELSNLADREKALQNKPEGFAALDADFTTAKTKIASLEGNLEELQKKRRSQEADIQTAQELVKKYQGQLMQVKNQQQYAAAWKEIDAARKGLKEHEDEALRLMASIEETEGELATLNGSFDDLASRHKASFDEWQSSLSHLREEAEGFRNKITALESGIPDPIKREFYQVYKQKGVGMVRVLDGTCAGCRVRIRPQVVQQIKRGELGRCEGCRRLLHP